MVMQGMSLSSLKKHPALIPLYVCVGLGCAGAIGYIVRLATRNPDVSWYNKDQSARSNEAYSEKMYKFYSPSGNYNPESKAPKF